MRQKSQQNNANKAAHIMDVNEAAVNKAIYRFDALLHGHTHRPEIHQSNEGKTRYVLGDWRLLNKDKRQQKVSAVIGAITASVDEGIIAESAEFELFEFNITI